MPELRYLLLKGAKVVRRTSKLEGDVETSEWSMVFNWLSKVLWQQRKDLGNGRGFFGNLNAFNEDNTYVLLLDRRSIAAGSPQEWILGPRHSHLVSGDYLLVAYAAMERDRNNRTTRAISHFGASVFYQGFGSLFLEQLREVDAFDSVTDVLRSSRGFWEKHDVDIDSYCD